MWGQAEVSPRSCSLHLLSEASRKEPLLCVIFFYQRTRWELPRAHINSFSIFCPGFQRGSRGGSGRSQSPDLQSDRGGRRRLHLHGGERQQHHRGAGPTHRARYLHVGGLEMTTEPFKMCFWRYKMLAALSHNLTSSRKQ